MITMATIGYGDMYPVTYFGRAVAMLGCIWGVFIISMLTVSLMKATEFNQREHIVYEDITKRRRLHQSASEIVQLYLLLMTYRKTKTNMGKRAELLLLLISQLSRFRRRGHDFSVKGLDQSTEIIEGIQDWMSEVSENYSDLHK